MLKQQERYTVSLELEFSKKEQNPLEQAISVLFDVGPNGYATGFLVGNGLGDDCLSRNLRQPEQH